VSGALVPAGMPGAVVAGGLGPRPRTRGLVLFGLTAITIFVGGFVAWSVMAPLSEAAIAPGQIKVEGQRRTIQHLEGGIVREILARDGDVVHRGQPLLRLDDVQSGSTLESLRGQYWAYLAQVARLNAELGRAETIAYPEVLRTAEGARAAEAMTNQQTLFEARRAALVAQIQVQQARIDQQQAVINGAEGQIRASTIQLGLIRREEEITRGLVQQGLQRLPQLLALQRNAAALEGTGIDLRGQIERARAGIAEARNTMRQIEDTRLQDAGTEMRDLAPRLADVEERMRAAEDVSSRREILAPEDGTIMGSRFFTIGAVVRAGDPVMELVPAQDRLVAEVNVAPSDIDVVHVGLLAEVRLPAFKQRLVPYLHGHVIFVANDVTYDERSRTSYYRAQISIDRAQLDRLENVTLVPGMPVETMVQTGSRSFLRYMIQPILDSFHRAFREQ
jgi:HlyD family secretion protein